MDQRDQQTPAPSRRDFIKTSAAVVGGTMASSLVIPGAYAAGTDEIKVGLIGCGGRGTGAVDNVLQAAEGGVLAWAMAAGSCLALVFTRVSPFLLLGAGAVLFLLVQP